VSAKNGNSSWLYLIVILVYALSFGPATYLATKSGFLRRANASKGAVFDFVFYPHYLFAENWPPYMNYVRWWESLAN
jgi:hypothetical protein